jgi:hypothetical protein
LREFHESKWRVLCTSAPRLATLRIERRQSHDFTNVGRDTDEREFAGHLLKHLAHLRSLALPYAAARLGDIFVAADRLDSLELAELHHGAAYQRATEKPATMHRLTRLVAELTHHTAADVLTCTPHVSRGQLTFETAFRYGGSGCMVVRLDPDASDSSDSLDENDPRIGDGVKHDGLGDSRETGGSRGGGGKRIAWRNIANAYTGEIPGLTRNVVRAISKLRTRWVAHDFDDAVSDEMRREIRIGLPVVDTVASTRKLDVESLHKPPPPP